MERVTIYCIYQLPEPAPPPSGCANFDDDTDDGSCYEVKSRPHLSHALSLL